MLNIEDFNKYDFSDVLRYMRKYVDITIEDAKDEQINEALETVSVDEVMLFILNYNINGVKYRSEDFLSLLSMYLNEEIKSYILSKGFRVKNSYFLKDKLGNLFVN
ncbi:hypothetical protein ACWNT8_15430 (plasmid) [Pigmentibacter ruber]